MSVPENLKRARENKLQRYESGVTKKIPIESIEAIALALEISVSELLGWDEKNALQTESNKKAIINDIFDVLPEDKQQDIIQFAKYIQERDLK